MLSQLIVAALAATVLADDSCSRNVEATSQADLDSINGCKKLDGDLKIDGSLSGANIKGVEEITGDLIINNATSLGQLSAPELKKVGKRFQLTSLTILAKLDFPKLTTVGSIQWTTLPALSSLGLGAGLNNASDVVISDTALTSLDGLNLIHASVINVNNNRYLKQVHMDLQSVSNSLDISFNGQSVSASFDSLQWANNITFRDVGSVSLKNLSAVNSSAGFINNSIETLHAADLTKIGGSLAIVSNSKLRNISFPRLESVGGGFQVANNTNLSSISGFPNLKSVGGAIDFTGNFTEADLPALNTVKGGVDVDSGSSKFNCSFWNSAHSNGDIQGDKYVCKGVSTSVSTQIGPTKAGSGSGSTGGSGSKASGSGDSSKSHAGAASTGVQSVSLLGALFAFALYFV